MKHIPRHEEILEILTKLRTITVPELTSRLGVSEVTIRKDLTLLEEMGYVIRSHGSARLAEDTRALSTINTRKKTNTNEKQSIGEKAKSLIREGDTIYLDSGSTSLALAGVIKNMSLRIITNSIDVMNTLAEEPGISLVCLGGNYRKEAGSFLGPLPMEALKNFQIETCFIGATGFLSRGIFSAQNIMESQLKAQVIQVSKRRVIMADSSKYEKTAFSVFARANEVDVLITDSGFKDGETLNKLGIEVLFA
ncbi:MAG: DeoR/GlpR transcriptional regulator [Spirochaetales bacterium]|nr:DeoR/GlpR transcriptional regulator [Spirochaetales bacterium]